MKSKLLKILSITFILMISSVFFVSCGETENTPSETVTYQVTFNSDGGSAVSSQEVEENKKATRPNDPTKTGYTFDGWYLEGTKWDFSSNSVSKDVELKAKWKLTTYSITYSLDGGENNQSNPITYTIEDSVTLGEPTKLGYNFLGWTNEGEIELGSTGNKEFTASWEIIVYNITYVLNGGTNATENPIKYTVEDEINLLIPTKEGYEFLGWSDNGTIAKGSTGDKEFTASWQKAGYTITYNLDGGENNPSNPYTYDAEDSITLEAPTKVGYTFKGWTNGGIIELGSTGNKEFTANWEVIKYNIRYVLNDGTNATENPIKYTVEDEINLLTPTKEGYEFLGWSDNGTIAKGSTGDKEFTASWQIVTYTISYILNNGENSSSNPATYTVNDTISLEAPTKLGYTFKGWSDNGIIICGSTGNKVFTANWEAIKYSITYVLNGGEITEGNPTTYTIEDTIVLSNPTKTGYEFTGWYNGDTKVTTIPKGSMGEIELKAKWKKEGVDEGFTPFYPPSGF